jgi:hypothetical protein
MANCVLPRALEVLKMIKIPKLVLILPVNLLNFVGDDLEQSA